MTKPTRMITHQELSDKFDHFSSLGVLVPNLTLAKANPTYLHTTENGTEVYASTRTLIEVPHGHVIVSGHGNVINLLELEEKARVQSQTPRLTYRR
ncbi:MAG: hypothetical protein KC535_03995 [Nanoarchaeota archaeon]|nr:hypothetical protein [Nanoarchaeota archaeon]